MNRPSRFRKHVLLTKTAPATSAILLSTPSAAGAAAATGSISMQQKEQHQLQQQQQHQQQQWQLWCEAAAAAAGSRHQAACSRQGRYVLLIQCRFVLQHSTVATGICCRLLRHGKSLMGCCCCPFMASTTMILTRTSLVG